MKYFLYTLAVIISYGTVALAQCSDAGVCTIGAKHQTLTHSIGVSYVFGKSSKTDDLTFHTMNLEGGFRLFEGSRLSVDLPWSRVNGPLGSTNGLGDVTVLWDQAIWDDLESRLSAQVGGKLATGNADAGNLPQAYQTGLGTNDLLLGIVYDFNPWTVAIGYQLSRGRSNNALTQLKRGDDFLVRMGYRGSFDDVHVSAEILAIRRLQESSFLNPAIPGGSTFVNVPESDQFQVNPLGRGSIPISESYSVQALAAVPLRNRKVNVDGLTRSLTLSLGLQLAI